jgi:phage gp29-like protein
MSWRDSVSLTATQGLKLTFRLELDDDTEEREEFINEEVELREEFIESLLWEVMDPRREPLLAVFIALFFGASSM